MHFQFVKPTFKASSPKKMASKPVRKKNAIHFWLEKITGKAQSILNLPDNIKPNKR